jgi:hypothetical protein
MNILAKEKLDLNPPNTNKKDSWIWQTGPVGQGKMSDREVAEWYEKCACKLVLVFNLLPTNTPLLR